MRIIFEEHQYAAADVQNVLAGISTLQDVDKYISVSYVGYFYNPMPEVKDCVFILPKVLLKDEETIAVDGKNNREVLADVPKAIDENGNERWVTPEDIITPKGQETYLPRDYRKFIYEFSVWMYRSLNVYRQNNCSSKAIYYKPLPQEGHGRRHQANTFLDIILSLIRFNKENQNFFLFTIKNLHSGQNKINWNKTISKSQCVIQDNDVVYLNPINKKRKIDFEDELFVIFFSILYYLNENYGFKAPINCRYELLTGKQFNLYLKGLGKVRLHQIKYKYFSDKTLQLWDLCYAFFDNAYKIAVNMNQQEYLLAKSFEHVFEAMMDDLIGEKDIPKGLKEQYDGKLVDHMYVYDDLIKNDDTDKDIYYIGDSKYYKNGHKLGKESIYKQYTYARNVIQWNIDLFMNNDNKEEERFKKIRLRNDDSDTLTEGYNVIPNFFISAYVNKARSYIEKDNIKIHESGGKHSTYMSCQFPDRLFDRDTLILSHYDVNFLYVIYLYSRNKSLEKSVWRNKVRKLFRDEIRNVLQNKYHFYAMKSKGNFIAGEEFIKEHFKELQGKLYRPYGDENLYVLALNKKDNKNPEDSEAYKLLSDFFVIKEVKELGENPKETLDKQVEQYQIDHPYINIPNDWLPEYHIERYVNECFMIGMYHDQEHWDWITGKNDHGSLIYNVRLDPQRDGLQVKSRFRKMKPKFAILYEEGHESDNKYHVFRIHDYAEMTQKRMVLAQYPINHGGPQGDYFIFRFDEEISIGKLDINKLISDQGVDYIKGSPIFPLGIDLLKYRL
jgi:hypothetical protein